ncbi:MAG TPA: protein translocase subunit SecD [Patescibacteria group bacterium]|nr:protein translocase subunit SecD [Patescibacteria group bacterium]
MTARGKIRLSLLGILLLTILAGIIDYPKGPDLHWGKIQREMKVQLGLDLQGGASLLYNADVSNVPDADRQNSLNGVRDIIEQRINAFGVSEPNIQTIRSGDDWRIAVELPGITDISEAIKRIGATPVLEFKTEGSPPEYTQEQKDDIKKQNEEAKKTAEEVLAKATAEGANFEELAKEYSQDPGSKDQGGDLGEFEQEAMVPEFDEVVFNKAEVGNVYPEVVETSFGYHIIRVDSKTPADQNNGTAKATAHHILLRKLPEEPPQYGPNYVDSGLTGEQLDRADVTFDPNTGLPTVSITFDEQGKELFAKITKENTGKTVAIYLDGQIISAPVVEQEITTGEAVISGDFTLEEAKELAQRLNAGALPVPVELISQQSIGPTLGQEAIERSLFAGAIGLGLLGIFMVVYYRIPGLMAMVSLCIYTLLVLAIFKLLPVTLTLAGIAGFILSIGMAVDANVLIFERMKEELRAGKPIPQSVRDGFRRAWTSIRDSNASSLITCLILYWFGSSLIRGFAITLAIGILVSMFSAITITQNILGLFKIKHSWWYGVKQTKRE